MCNTATAIEKKMKLFIQGQTIQHLITGTDNSEKSPILLKHLRKPVPNLAVRNPQLQ